MRSKKNIYVLFMMLLTAFVFASNTWGQTTTNDLYKNDYESESIKSKKQTKWHDLRKEKNQALTPKRDDKFDMDTRTFEVNWGGTTTQIQASHVLVDTIYVHEGSFFNISLPDVLEVGTDITSSVKSYQRWYNFRTGKIFQVKAPLKKDGRTITDLLLPNTRPEDLPYRLTNGYVGQPLSTYSRLKMTFYYPTTDEYNSFTNKTEVNPDNNEYLIACDVSGYTDYTESFVRGESANSKFTDKFYEPTLSHRFIYCIRSIENKEDWRRKFFEEQQKVTDPAQQKYLEEYEINAPSIRIPDKTKEMISIASSPNAYAVPVAKDQDNHELTVTLEEDTNTAGIKLRGKNKVATSSLTLTGNDRIIHFEYPNTDLTYGTENVNKGPDGTSTATILVTRDINGTTYRIARFKLTFRDNSVLLTQSQLNQITNGKAGNTWWATYSYRTPDYLEKNYTFVTGMDFDFDPDIAGKYGLPQVYPYPIGWSESSYGFYDGSATAPTNNNNKDFKGKKNRQVPQWGYYAILNTYTEVSTDNWGLGLQLPSPPLYPVSKNRNGESSTYHMYIDASDQPGLIARLKFDKKLCPGSELFVSAWVKVAKAYYNKTDSKGDNAGMLFTIMGVTDNNGKSTYTPIYRHQTSQIPATCMNGQTSNLTKIPGIGNNNEWLQVYFSFVNRSETKTDFDSYVLQVDNKSASTSGGDMYIDDIRVYISPSNAKIEQKSYTCDSYNSSALLKMTFDWERLLSRTGVIETTEKQDATARAHISYCFVDSAMFIAKYDSIGNPDNETAIKKAFEESIEPIAYPNKTDDPASMTNFAKFGKLLFDPHYDSNNEYQPEETNIQDLTDATKAGALYRVTESSIRNLTADLYCKLKPFRTYFLILEQNHDPEDTGHDGSYIPDVDRFKYFYMEPKSPNSCVTKTSFRLKSQNRIKVNGVLYDGSSRDFCAGQIVNFTVQLYADIPGKGLTLIKDDVYFDWFTGSLEEFNKNQGDISIHESLIDFRNKYPNATDLKEWVTRTEKEEKEKELLTSLVKEGRLIIRQLLLNAPIIGQSGDIFNLVVSPIPIELKTEEGVDIIICTDPTEVPLNITGNTPVAQVGFEDVIYPDESASSPDKSYHSAIRIGKDQLTACNTASSMLEIPLRGIAETKDSDESDNTSNPDTESSSSFSKSATYPYLYLIDSNDPVVLKQMADIDDKGVFDNTTWPVATINEIKAVPNPDGDISKTADQYMRLYFAIDGSTTKEGLPVINFREGYRYTLLAYFNENKPGNTCEGNLTFDIKVVPEYQKWSGPADGSGNWNNDNNWLRSTATELHKTDANATNYDNDYNTAGETYYGLVPMNFTKVTIPIGKQVQLYKATANMTSIGSSDHAILDLAKPTTITNPATTHIEYDLMVKEATINSNNVAYNCETYYTNTADQIHFEPSTAMLHAELLTYQKAWIDYKLTGSRWYTLASPLQSVVAGDWYTMNTGTQTTEYFEDINFTTPNYNRFQPSVYQRGWKQQADMITIGNDGSSNGKTVVVAGNWSGVYNDVAVPYTPGLGFSVKVLNLSTTTSATDPTVALFRFPKADTEYSYYESGSTTEIGTINVRTSDTEKNKAGRLKSDELKPTGSTPDSPTITVTLDKNTASKDADYHLIGNPFMAYLDASKFFDANSNLQPKYWMVTGNNQTAAVGGTSSSDWIANIGDATRIAPLQSFFVEKKETSTYVDNNTVTFSANMQALAPTGPTASSAALKSSSPLPLLTLVATTADGRQSRAVIAYDRTASEEYKANEDAELFLDSNLGDLPAIYTVTGTMAASINRTSNLWNIPVGTYSNRSGNNGNNPETVTLTFEGLDRFTGTTLYDVEKKTETALHHNSSITIAANTYGRYFLRAGTPTGNEKVETETIRIYTIVRGQLIVTATENLQTVAIYDFAGRLLRYSDTPSGCLFTTHLDKGNYIVRATSEHQQQTSKIQIR